MKHSIKLDRVYSLAAQSAARRGHAQFEPLDLAMALCQCGDPAIAARFRSLGVDPDAFLRVASARISKAGQATLAPAQPSAQARQIMIAARIHAAKLSDPEALPEHLLEVGQLWADPDVTGVLTTLQVPLSQVLKLTSGSQPTESPPAASPPILRPGASAAGERIPPSRVDALTSAAVKVVLARAVAEARELGDAVALPSHLLLAIVRADDDAVASVFRFARIDRGDVHKAIARAIRSAPPGKPPRFDGEMSWPGIEGLGVRVAAMAERVARKKAQDQLLHLLDNLLARGDPLVEQAFLSLSAPLHRLKEAVSARLAVEELAPPPEVAAEQGDPSSIAEANVTSEKRSERKAASATPTPTLDMFGRDLTALARQRLLGPVIGRKHEIRLAARTLLRKEKRNPVLLGDPGVGKTSVVEGLALKCVSPDALPELKTLRIVEISMSSLVAGAKLRGDFEERVEKVLAELRNAPEVVLFIDELHTVIGSGRGEASPQDGASILKVPLGRGDFRCIGATTRDAWNRLVDADPALARRFMPIRIEEPSRDDTVEILKGVRASYEAHHGLRISDAAIEAAVDLSIRYLPDRRLPDKARDLIDQGCTNLRVGTVTGFTMKKLETSTLTADHIAEVVSIWAGIPVGRVKEAEARDLSRLEEQLKAVVFGQDEAVSAVASAIRKSRAGFGRPNRPIGVFLFLGPTGVGKTELAKGLAAALFGGTERMVRVDMSELQDENSVNRLIGSPPGYVGHESGGALTEAVRTQPHSIVLLDEVEKAHPRVLDVFLQVFDDARLTDGKGVTVDFRNTVILMTSNVRTDPSAGQALGFGAARKKGKEGRGPRGSLTKEFRPEFLNRIDEIVVFRPLGPEQVRRIIDKLLTAVEARLRERGMSLRLASPAYDALMAEGFDEAFGAREMERVVDYRIVRPIADLLVGGGISEGATIEVAVVGGEIRVRSA